MKKFRNSIPVVVFFGYVFLLLAGDDPQVWGQMAYQIAHGMPEMRQDIRLGWNRQAVLAMNRKANVGRGE